MHSRSNKVQMEIGRNDPKNTKNRALDVEKPAAGGKNWGICFYTVDLDPPGGVGGSPETLGK